MESYESYLYDEQNDVAIQVLTTVTVSGFTLRQLQTIRANSRSIIEAVDNKISEYTQQVRDALDELDGTRATAVSLLTGVPLEDFEKYGGLDESD